MAVIWNISTLRRNVEDGGVFVAYWTAIQLDGDYSVTEYGAVNFTPDPTAEDFIAYESLSESDVMGWVKAEIVEADIEAKLAAEIAKQKVSEPGIGVPWLS